MYCSFSGPYFKTGCLRNITGAVVKAKKFKITRKGLIACFLLLALTAAGAYRVFLYQKPDFYSYRYPVEHNEFSSYEKEFDKIKNFYIDKIKSEPHNAHDKAMLAHYYLGAAREFSRDDYFEEAAKFALASIKQQPSKNSAALKVLAELALSRHESKRARNYGFTLLKMDPLTPEAYAILVESFLQTGELESANKHADDLIALFPSQASFTLRAEVLAQQGRAEEALVDYNQAFIVEDEDAAQAVRTRNSFARFCMNVGKNDLAEKVLKEAFRINPKSSRTLYELGELQLKMKKPEEASLYFKQAFQESKQLSYLYAEARAHKEKGDMEYSKTLITQIEGILREQVKKNKRSANAAELIRLLLERGNPADIREGLRLAKAENARRMDSESSLLLAWALEKNNNLHEARKNIRGILSRNIKTPELFQRASSIESKLKNRPLAEVYSKRASLQISSDYKTLWY